ncbi:MAG: MFS transporter [Actinomycetia bacterium]|nr:MFS transporter [Actinomycetes bacterium]
MTEDTSGTTGLAPPLWLIFSITVTGIMANTLISASIPDILHDFGEPDGSAGLLVAASPAPGIVLAPIMGVLADRYGRRAVLVPSLLAFGLAGLGAALAPSFELLLAARFAQGAGSASLIGLSVTIISDHWEGNDRARFIGWNSAVLTVCIALFPAIGGFLTELGTWRYAYIPMLWSLVCAGLIASRLSGGGTGDGRITDRIRVARHGLRQPIIFAPTLLAFVIFALIFGLFLTAMPLLLEDRFGLSAGERGLVIVVPALSATVAALLLGRTRKALGGRRLTLLGTAVLAISYAAVGWAASITVLLVASLAYGWAEGATIPTLQDLVAGNAPGEARAAVVSIYTSFLRAGQTIGPLVVGALLGVIETHEAFFYGGAILALAAVAQFLVPAERIIGRSEPAT